MTEKQKALVPKLAFILTLVLAIGSALYSAGWLRADVGHNSAAVERLDANKVEAKRFEDFMASNEKAHQRIEAALDILLAR